MQNNNRSLIEVMRDEMAMQEKNDTRNRCSFGIL